MSDAGPYSASQLGDYLFCQRHYEYDREWDLTLPDETIRYRRRGTVMHDAIEAAFDAVDAAAYAAPPDHPDDKAVPADDLIHVGSPDRIDPEPFQTAALEAFDDRWAAAVGPDLYESRAHHDYDRRVCREAVRAYTAPDGAGIDHARSLVLSEVLLRFDYDGIPMVGRMDTVYRTDDGLTVLDYKSSSTNVVSSSSYWASNQIEGHLDGETRNPRKLKTAIQAELYRAAAAQLPTDATREEIGVAFHVLRKSVDFEPHPDGGQPTVTGKPYDVTGAVLDSYGDELRALIGQLVDGIRARQFEPDPFPLIHEETCEDCPYRAACADYLGEEVRRVD